MIFIPVLCPPLSHRPGHEGWQDQSAHLKHDRLFNVWSRQLKTSLPILEQTIQ